MPKYLQAFEAVSSYAQPKKSLETITYFQTGYELTLKFDTYCRKTTKFEETCNLTFEISTQLRQNKVGEFFEIFVAFSEYLNFNNVTCQYFSVKFTFAFLLAILLPNGNQDAQAFQTATPPGHTFHTTPSPRSRLQQGKLSKGIVIWIF